MRWRRGRKREAQWRGEKKREKSELGRKKSDEFRNIRLILLHPRITRIYFKNETEGGKKRGSEEGSMGRKCLGIRIMVCDVYEREYE